MKVREMIRMLKRDGWIWIATRGSHRQFRHPWKPGKVTAPGSMRDDLHPRTCRSILRQAGLRGRP